MGTMALPKSGTISWSAPDQPEGKGAIEIRDRGPELGIEVEYEGHRWTGTLKLNLGDYVGTLSGKAGPGETPSPVRVRLCLDRSTWTLTGSWNEGGIDYECNAELDDV
jgi:hypothetical protein